MTPLDLTPDALLTTTRSVRKRLDFDRPVERDVIEDCLRLAIQAPTGGNRQGWHWVVVTDPPKRLAIAELYRRSFEGYLQLPVNSPSALEQLRRVNADRAATQERVRDSSSYLADHMHEAPALIIPCILGRPEHLSAMEQASMWGSILPAVWSLMLALRSRGLGSAWTTLHLAFEQEAAEIVGIPFQKVTQAALLPVAWTKGTDFKPAPRDPLVKVTHWDQW